MKDDNITITTNTKTLTDSLTSDPKTWLNTPLISVTQLHPSSGLRLLFQTASSMRTLVQTKGGDSRLQNKILASVFYEPSTRTSCSFQAAMLRLGGTFLHVDAGKGGNTSASKKGESLSDTIRCLECYTDVTVLRHGVQGSVAEVALGGGIRNGIVNAGDGVGEHPTQALLDLFTIVDELCCLGVDMGTNGNNSGDGSGQEEIRNGQTKALSSSLERMEPLVVVLLGDLKHGRTVHSLAKLLARTQDKFLERPLVLRYCSPDALQMPQSVKDYVEEYCRDGNIVQEEVDDITDAIKGAHVLYVTRVQKERFSNLEDYEKVKGAYVVNAELLSMAPSKMIVMHPLPRVDEISTDIDSDPRAAYFRQMENGMYVRMAILALILGKP